MNGIFGQILLKDLTNLTRHGRLMLMDTTHDTDQDINYEGEVYAEFVASWVSGGGSASDASTAWATGIAHANGYWGAPEGDVGGDRPYYMDLTDEEREADNLAFEMGQEDW
jgi:hypothetical protein